MTAPRTHGPTRSRQVSGELHGPADTSRQVRAITVRVEQLPDGRWRLAMPRVPAWAAAASNAAQLAVALRGAFREAQCAAYSDWRGHQYDAEVPMHRRRRNRPGHPPNVDRRDVHPPNAWRLAPDGRWVSPRGLLYPEDTDVVQKVMRRRHRLGLSPRPDPVEPGEITDMVARNEAAMGEQGRTA